MKTLFAFLLAIHIAAGTLAVLAGAIALATTKPVGAEGRWHRRAGLWFQRFMFCVIASAAFMTLIHFSAYFAGLTAAATFGVFSGQRVLGRKRPDLDVRQRARVLDWIVTLIIAGVAAFLIWLLITGGVTRNVPVVRALAYGTMAYAAYDLWRFARPLAFPFTPRLWLYEHILKMIGGYFGAVAAFSGSVLVLFPPPWRQLWATLAGQILSMALIIRYARRMRSA